MEVITPTNARKNLYEIIKHVVADSQPVEIANTKEQESVIMISKSDWNSLQETLNLQNVGGFESIPRTRFVRIFSRFQRVSISSFRPAVKPKPFDR